MKIKLFLCFILIFFLLSCKSSNVPHKENNDISKRINGTLWELTDISGNISDINLSSLDTPITIAKKGNIVNIINATVNKYFYSYKINGNSISFEPIGATKMGGPEDLMKMEYEYFKILGNVKNIELQDKNTLILKTGTEILKFNKK